MPKSSATRSDTDLIDVPALNEWIGDRLPGSELPLTAERIGTETGVANALFVLRRGEISWVLRRPPSVRTTPSASNMRREWRILEALEGTDVPHPTPLLFCEDGGPLGAPFILMDHIDGFTPTGVLPDPYTTAENRRNLAMAMVDAIADLGNVDWAARGLDGLGKPGGFLERQVPRWTGQLETYATRTVPNLERLAAWLEDNCPAAGRPGLMHGDYSPFNVMASYTDTERLAAVIDWDTGTVGDPLLDIAHLLARWTEPGEEPVLGNWDIGAGEVELRLGLPSRADMAARYVQRSGRQLDALPYYQALALFKLGVMLEGRVRSDLAAGNAKGADKWKIRVDRLIAFGLQFATGERR